MRHLVIFSLLCVLPAVLVEAVLESRSARAQAAGTGATLSPSRGIIGSNVEISFTAEDPIAELQALRRQVQSYRGLQAAQADRHAKMIGLALLLAALLKVLLSVLGKVELLTDRWKDWLPGIVLMLGAAAVLLTKFAAGEDWLSAALMGGSGPGAVFAHEFGDMVAKWRATRKGKADATSAAGGTVDPAAPAASVPPVVPGADPGAAAPADKKVGP